MPRIGKLGIFLGVAALALALIGAAMTFDAAAEKPNPRPDPPPQKTDNSGLMQRGLGL